MPPEKPGTGQGFSSPFSTPAFGSSFLPQLEWFQKSIEMSAASCSQLLALSMKGFQMQADFLQSMAGCSDLNEAFKRQSEFMQSFWDMYAKEFAKILDQTKLADPTRQTAAR